MKIQSNRITPFTLENFKIKNILLHKNKAIKAPFTLTLAAKDNILKKLEYYFYINLITFIIKILYVTF